MDPLKKRVLLAIASGVALLIGIVAIAVPLILDATRTVTSVEGTQITASIPDTPTSVPDSSESAQVIGVIDDYVFGGTLDNPSTWWIPVDAPFTTMPNGSECGPEQRAWLVKYGIPETKEGRLVRVQVHNTASTGAAMSISNIHVEGKFVERTQLVRMTCAGTGASGSQVMNLALDGSPALWGYVTDSQGNPPVEGSLATINLSPGEIADLTFDIADSSQRFVGRIVADLITPESGVVVLAEELSIDPTPVPGYHLDFTSGQSLACSQPGNEYFKCTFAEAEALLREAGRS